MNEQKQRHWQHWVQKTQDEDHPPPKKNNKKMSNKLKNSTKLEMNPGAHEGWAVPASYKTPSVVLM